MNRSQTNVLIVGSEGTGKHDISNCLLDIGHAINLRVLTCKCLPLPEDRDFAQENIQFVCFVMHMSNKDSMKALIGSIGQIDVSYFVGRSVIIANTKGLCTDEGISRTELKNLATRCDIQVLFCDTEDPAEKTDLCRKLMKMIETAAGWRKNVTPLLYDTIQTLPETDSSIASNRKMSAENPVFS
ncbi:centromere protein M-like [Mercenaria mercenaria]|uniref:centromere protein M-like n=1 Tax=Mercenaria mercenaria TaxID=6596 RepID=UPI00234EC38F|nr:centromere protein M-like [Mercenaria mercenaria]